MHIPQRQLLFELGSCKRDIVSSGPEVIKKIFMLNSAEHEICLITNN